MNGKHPVQGDIVGAKVKVLLLADGKMILIRVGDSRVKQVEQAPHGAIEDVEACVARLRDLANVIEQGAEELKRAIVPALEIVR